MQVGISLDRKKPTMTGSGQGWTSSKFKIISSTLLNNLRMPLSCFRNIHNNIIPSMQVNFHSNMISCFYFATWWQ